MYDSSFKARKSMFFFGKRIIAMGSGISSDDQKNIAVTTLFQNALLPGNKNCFKYSMGDQEFPLEKTFKGKSFWMIDSIGNGFYIPSGNDSVKLMRKYVKNPYHINWNPQKPEVHKQIEANEGEIELAYIDHGTSSRDCAYTYCILVQADGGEMREFAASMAKIETAPYKILRRDREAHIIYDVPSRTSAYVMFDAGNTGVEGILKHVDKPCMVMIRKLDTGGMRLSLYNPDFDSYPKFGNPEQYDAPVKISLNGKWKLRSENSQVEQVGDSKFIVHGKNAEPVSFELH